MCFVVAFKFQTISEHSHNNPVIHNVIPKMNEWMGITNLDKKQRIDLETLCFNCLNRLSICFEIMNELEQQHVSCEESWRKRDVRNSAFIPGIVDLDSNVENFANHSKNVLRDLTRVFNLVFDTKFIDAVKFARTISKKGVHQDSDAMKFVINNHPEKSDFIDFLRSYQDSNAVVNSIRNAFEHPNGKSGTISIENYKLIEHSLISPVWKLENRNANAILNSPDPTPLLDGISRIFNTVFCFTEGILVFLIFEHVNREIFTINKISDGNGAPNQPVRYDIRLNAQLSRALSEAQHSKI